MKPKPKFTEAEYKEHVDSDDGLCTRCGHVQTEGYVEPDAEDYACEECHEQSVMGFELALISEELELS